MFPLASAALLKATQGKKERVAPQRQGKRDRGSGKVKRITVLITVVALMVVMLAMSVTPAFAKSTYTCSSQYGTHSGVPKEAAMQGGFYFDCVKERK